MGWGGLNGKVRTRMMAPNRCWEGVRATSVSWRPAGGAHAVLGRGGEGGRVGRTPAGRIGFKSSGLD